MVDTTTITQPPSDNQLQENTVMISIQTSLDGYRLKNFYITNSLQGFVWMIFHFSVIFFFTFLLNNIALVGIFLGFANFVAFLIDIPLGIIQRYISTKKLFIIAAIAQLIAVGIFFGFIFKVFSILEFVSGEVAPNSLQDGLSWFFGSAINWIGVIIASLCYGIAKELNDVSTYGYILSHANPSEYGTILARNNITFGIGSLVGLLLSGVLLSFSPYFAVISLGIIIVLFLIFTIRYFDNDMDSVSLKDIENFKVSIQRWNSENVKEYIVEIVKKADIEKVIQGAKYLMIKPKQKIEEKIPWKEVILLSKREFSIIWEIFSEKTPYKNLIWTITLILTFGFWDTFASSFLLDFLDNIEPGWSFVLLAIIGIPGIVLQEQAGMLSKKIGAKTVGLIGLVLSGSSLILLGVGSLFENIHPMIILGFALINSLGYACGMSTGQNQFLDTYNRIYAKHEKLNEINSNASSGPIKILQNLANVIGLMCGGFIVGVFGYTGFFILFGIAIFALLGWSIQHRGDIHL